MSVNMPNTIYVEDSQTLVVDRPGLFLWIYIFDMNLVMKISKIMPIPESSGVLSSNKGLLGLLKKLPSARKFWPYRSLEGATAKVGENRETCPGRRVEPPFKIVFGFSANETSKHSLVALKRPIISMQPFCILVVWFVSDNVKRVSVAAEYIFLF